MLKKVLPLVFSLFIISTIVKAQYKAEVGVISGRAYYIGDVNPKTHFYSTNQAVGGFFKYNLDNRLSLNISLVKSKLTANDQDFINQYQQTRKYKFSNSIVDVCSQIEFNFLKFGTDARDLKFSPYLAGGVGFVLTSQGESVVIPFGFGFKVLFSNRLCIGTEWSIRKTFTDNLDFLSNNYNYDLLRSQQNKQKSFDNNKDFYSFASIFVSLRIINVWRDCPAYH